jgi:hypothetical protein
MSKHLLSRGRIAEARSAEGAKGFILLSPIGKPFFRIYHEDKTFKDYAIRHWDIEVIITAKDVFFYEIKGKPDDCFIDYDPIILGLKETR